MGEGLDLNYLINTLKEHIKDFPDKRTGLNCKFSLEDISLSAFSVFFTLSPSFLAHQKLMYNAKRKSNAQTIFQIKDIPSDNHIRDILDYVQPDYIYPVFNKILRKLESEGELDKFKSFSDTYLLPIDGTQYFTSKNISCKNCSKREHKDGSITYFHNLLTPAIVSPGLRKALVLPPEFMTPQEGKKKQDHELEAAKRWLNRSYGFIKNHSVTILGDDLYSNQPFCKAVTDKKLKYIFVCKPKSHKELYRWIDFFQKNKEIESFSKRIWTGKEYHNYSYRFINNIPIRDSKDAINVNWAEIIITNDSGKKIYSNAFISNHIITKDNIESFIEAGRARWKIENETNNTLKTKGYNLEHNFGHGKHYLSQTLATLTILAFLFHTVLSLVDNRYQVLRNNLGRRDTFFHDISALMKYMIFEHWIHLLKTMLTGLELEDPG